MIHSRAKPHAISKLIERLESADVALCNAALTNTLTKSGETAVVEAALREFFERRTSQEPADQKPKRKGK